VAAHPIVVSTNPSDPNAPLGMKPVETDIADGRWWWTHTDNSQRKVPRQTHGPFPTEEEALNHAQETLGGSLEP
jgi:hypothetical protein